MPENGAKTELFSQSLNTRFVVADQSLSTGRRFWVSSTSATGGTGGGYGSSPDIPITTLDGAIALCTANQGDIVHVMEGHAESETADAAIATIDVAGVTVVGLGAGDDRPTFSLGHANATIDVTAANVTIKNIVLGASIANVVAAVSLSAAADGFTIKNCALKDGGTNILELKVGVAVATTVSDLTVKDNEFLTVEGGTITSAITFAGTHSDARITGNLMNGDFASAAILGTAGAGTRCLITDNDIKVKDGEPGIELKSDTTGLIINNNIASTGVSADAAIVAAACEWFENYAVTADGATGELIGTVTDTVQAIGSQFMISKSVTQSAIVAAGANLTGAASGTLLLVDCIVQNGSTAFDSGGDAGVLELYSTNVSGSGSFMTETEANLGANVAVSLRGATTGQNLVLETTKLLKYKATAEDFTSGGAAVVYMIFERLTAGATIAAA